MKKQIFQVIAIIFLLAISNVVFAQASHTIDFEPSGVGANWNWIVGENADNPPLEFIANPVSGGINTSATVAKFTARQAGNPWALFFTDDDGQFTFDATNSIVKIMVYKPVISPVHFKVEGGTGTPTELSVANTVTNQWQELTFDFSSVIGQTYSRLVIIPDFYARPQDNIIYIDNIRVPDGVILSPIHTINFEPSGVGATWNWIVAENADNPPLEFIANPVSGGINTSATVAKFIARQAGNPWALFFTDDDGQFTFNSSNAIVKIMVYKPVISPIHFKVEGLSPAVELVSTNTVVNQWEEITFDFSSVIGNTYSRLVILPDFYARPQDNIIYIDNIQVPDGVIVTIPEPTVPAPVPTLPQNEVISIFSNAYTNLSGVNFNPNWGQSTTVSFITVQGDTVMRYNGLNYQGTELNQNLNLVSAGMQYIHIDFWSANSTELNFFLISPGPNQQSVSLIPPGTTQQWVSVDMPLSQFQPTVNLTEVFQMMFTGNGTIYLDNIYFSTRLSTVREVENSFPSNFRLEQNYPNPFNPSTNIRFSLPEANQVTLKVYDLLGQEVATLVNQFMNAGTFEISFDASNLPTGIYTYLLKAGNFQSFKKMILVK